MCNNYRTIKKKEKGRNILRIIKIEYHNEYYKTVF